MASLESSDCLICEANHYSVCLDKNGEKVFPPDNCPWWKVVNGKVLDRDDPPRERQRTGL